MSKDRAESVETAEIAAILKTDSGRKVILRVLNSTGYFSNTFDHDPIKHAYNAGRRSIGVALVAEIKAAGEFVNLIRDQNE